MLEKNYFFDCLIVGCLAVGCGIDPAGPSGAAAGGSGTSAGSDTITCAYGQTVCVQSGSQQLAKVCDGRGGFTDDGVTCPGQCLNGLGCVMCAPNTSTCEDSTKITKVCDASGVASQFTCDGPGMDCDRDHPDRGCLGPCSPTSLDMSNVGCDFWPTVTANPIFSDPSGFHFAVMLGNKSQESASVQIFRGSTLFTSVTIDAQQAKSVNLDWDADLKGPDWTAAFVPTSITQSEYKAGGAYHIQSNQPIVAYQLSPIEALAGAANPNNCPNLGEENKGCYSYSTDGSMLIPSHVLTSSYVATGYRSWRPPATGVSGVNGGSFLTITALQSGSVRVTPGAGQSILGIPNLVPANGGPFTVPMKARDVLQLFTAGLSDDDTFSGTVVEETGGHPLQVLTGASCGTVPSGTGPCGHMEDAVLPVSTLGTEYVVPALPRDQEHCQEDPVCLRSTLRYTLRIQAMTDGTALSFEPAAMYRNVTLNRGDVLELPGTDNARITGTAPFAVTQYMNGGDKSRDEGGPAQLMVPPRSQYQQEYWFLASPQTDLSSFAVMMAPTGTSVTLDQRPLRLDMFTAVGASGMSVLRLPLNENTKLHYLKADRPVGVIVYGWGSSNYTNYLYSAGQQFVRTADSTP